MSYEDSKLIDDIFDDSEETEVDKIYYEEEKKIRKYFDTQLLSELLYINTKYPNSGYYCEKKEYLYDTIFDTVVYTDEELTEIRNNAIQLLKIKYNINADDYYI